MKVPHIEGVVIHDGPESCVRLRKGSVEALTGECAGVVSSLVNMKFRAPTLWTDAEGNTGRCVSTSAVAGPAWSETHCMHGSSMRGNREVPWLPVRDGLTGRGGKA